MAGDLGTLATFSPTALASDAAAFITGATLVVDGGHSWSGYDLP